jgi:hypothetical protein
MKTTLSNVRRVSTVNTHASPRGAPGSSFALALLQHAQKRLLGKLHDARGFEVRLLFAQDVDEFALLFESHGELLLLPFQTAHFATQLPGFPANL